MDHFQYKNGTLYAENVAVNDIADAVGTPFYCYSTATLRHHMQVFASGLEALNPRICFAVKANSNPHILRILHEAGAGADVVSEGEIRLALVAGIPADQIIFSGVGKTRTEMHYALKQGIFQFNVESSEELHVLNDVAQSCNCVAPIALRINPDVDAGTHEKITTGRNDSKFGIPIDLAHEIYRQANELPHIQVQGVSVHIGSQLTSLEPFRQAFIRVRQFVEAMRRDGYTIDVVDLGGGLGIPYHEHEGTPPLPVDYGEMVTSVMQGLDATFAFEPGRLIAGNAGIVVSRVIYHKTTPNRQFLIIDTGMNDLLRPAMYDAFHQMIPVKQQDCTQAYDVVGPVCESSDVFGRNVSLPHMQRDDLLALRSAGAYGASMSSTYNSRLVIPEVLVDGDSFRVIRPRPSYDELISNYSSM